MGRNSWAAVLTTSAIHLTGSLASIAARPEIVDYLRAGSIAKVEMPQGSSDQKAPPGQPRDSQIPGNTYKITPG